MIEIKDQRQKKWWSVEIIFNKKHENVQLRKKKWVLITPERLNDKKIILIGISAFFQQQGG